MNIVFAGTPEFARVALQALVQAGFSVPLVLTQPDRPAGRGLKLQASPVKQYALEQGMAVEQPRSLRLDGKFPDDAARAQAALRSVQADVMVVAAYGLILPQWVLDLPPLGCLNIHASLLPRWRGAAPIQRAILAGDAETGVCIMQMEAGLDTGPVLAQGAIPIDSTDTAASLHDKLAALGASLIVDVLGRLPLPALAQPDAGVTYAAKIEKAEALLNWNLDAAELDRRIRAFNPFPGTQTQLAGQGIKIWGAQSHAGTGSAGEVLAVDQHGIVVACGKGALRITELQKAGGKRLPVAQFLAGTPVQVGQRFDSPAAAA